MGGALVVAVVLGWYGGMADLYTDQKHPPSEKKVTPSKEDGAAARSKSEGDREDGEEEGELDEGEREPLPSAQLGASSKVRRTGSTPSRRRSGGHFERK
jgi:hypothetical protein